MSSETDEELESQARKTQEATPGGISEPGGPWRKRWRGRVREFTAPIRGAMQQSRTWYEGLPTWASDRRRRGPHLRGTRPVHHERYLGVAAGYWEAIAVKIGIAALAGAGAERRGGVRRPPRLGLRGVLRHRGLHVSRSRSGAARLRHRHLRESSPTLPRSPSGTCTCGSSSSWLSRLPSAPESSWGRRRCGCAATTWPSSPWGSARSCGSRRTTSTRITNGAKGINQYPAPGHRLPGRPLPVRGVVPEQPVLLAAPRGHRGVDLPAPAGERRSGWASVGRHPRGRGRRRRHGRPRPFG